MSNFDLEDIQARVSKARDKSQSYAELGGALGSVIPGIGTAAGATAGTIAGYAEAVLDAVGDMFGGGRHFASYNDGYGSRMMPIGWKPDQHLPWETSKVGHLFFNARRAQEDGVSRSIALAYLSRELAKINPALGRALLESAKQKLDAERRALKFQGFETADERARNPVLAAAEHVPGNKPLVRTTYALHFLRRAGVGHADAAAAVEAKLGELPALTKSNRAWAKRTERAMRVYLAEDAAAPSAPTVVHPGTPLHYAAPPAAHAAREVLIKHQAAQQSGQPSPYAAATVQTAHETLRRHHEGRPDDDDDDPRIRWAPHNLGGPAHYGPTDPRGGGRGRDDDPRIRWAPHNLGGPAHYGPTDAPAYLRPRPELKLQRLPSMGDAQQRWRATWRGHELVLSRSPDGRWIGRLTLRTAGGTIELTASADERMLRALVHGSGLVVGGDEDPAYWVGAAKKAVVHHLANQAHVALYRGPYGLSLVRKGDWKGKGQGVKGAQGKQHPSTFKTKGKPGKHSAPGAYGRRH